MERKPAPKCGARKRQGPGTCQNPAGFKTDHVGTGHCHLHGGATRAQRTKAGREIAVRAQAAALTKLGLIAEGTDALAALQEALDRARADVHVAALRVAALDPTGWTQRDQSGRFERPSVLLEIYWNALDRYERVARNCVALGIAAVAANVIRRDAEQIITLLQAFVHRLGMSWDAPEVQDALTWAYGRLEEVG